MMNKDDIYNKIKPLFPLSYEEDSLASVISEIKRSLYSTLESDDQPRYPGSYHEEAYQQLIDKYSRVEVEGHDHASFLDDVVNDLFNGVPRWKSPNIAYNICAAPNLAATAIYALALDENVHNVNNGLSGNTLVAEQAVIKMLAELADVETKPYGLFTFGGTSTNLYGMKIGIRKCSPDSIFSGLDGKVRVLLTEDCHFSHASNADWLGIGLDNTLTIEANKDRTSSLTDAYKKACQVVKDGYKLAAIVLNGGTTYGHTIDDIKGFVELRDRLVKEYKLPYKPHIHVDSVIGWPWLSFKDYDFDRNPLEILPEALPFLKRQYERISQVKLADSWGIDFHKGLGATPASSSMVMVNNFEDIALLSKKVSSKTEVHHLAHEFSSFSPADYTLETTRAAGAALAALVSLRVLGLDGIRRNLANLIEQTILMRKLITDSNDMFTLNADSEGFVTMVRFLPVGRSIKNIYEYTADELKEDNKYLNAFFKWDKETRIDKGIGVEYSVSSSYIKAAGDVGVAAVKLYPTSPHFNAASASRMVQTLVEQKGIFDATIWAEQTA